VPRLWTAAVVANAFHVLPSVAARALDEDPERVDIECLELLNYARVKRLFDDAKSDEELAPYANDETMLLVRRNTFDVHHSRTHPGDDRPGCPQCVRNREARGGR